MLRTVTPSSLSVSLVPTYNRPSGTELMLKSQLSPPPLPLKCGSLELALIFSLTRTQY